MTRYTLLAFLCLITLVAYLQRSALGVPSKAIEGELGLTPEAMGIVWFAWYAGYAAFQLPAGWLADRLGSKPALLIFAVTWSALTAVVGFAGGFVGLALLWGLMGAAQAGIFPCATKAIGATFPKTEQGLASGALACFMAGGAALSQEVTGRLFGPLTWQAVLVVYAVPGLAWALLFAVAVPRPDAPRPVVKNEPFDWTLLVADRDMVLLCLQQLMRAGATALFFTWFPRVLQETKHVTPAESGSLATWPLLAGVVGALVGGSASDWLLRRTGREKLSRCGLSAVCMAVAAVAAVAAYFASAAVDVVVLLSVAAFCAYVAGPAAYAAALSMGGTRVAIVFATMNMAGNVGAGLFPYAAGKLVGTAGDWNGVYLLFGGMCAGAGVCWVFLNPARTLYEEPT
ncbi:MFS transporter [Urbifossiella limnaea]|uniref:Putative sulfoacetate transporter SauU n=1 Tax=Urbifossiella limnaea TaxID=2528023 RepID=A0A517XTJ7_9BACT|nr:MFS transporter [Urbifossiella limnaea]QDU20818.1 putative sulfoacetate transporter SauU [Urbifossiella limnaea]